jgi:hypothetical protein
MDYGTESWELDALEPAVIVDLIKEKVLNHRDEGLWEIKEEELEYDLAQLDKIVSDLSD